MILPLLFFSATAFGTVQTNITPYNLPDTTVILRYENDTEFTRLQAEKAYITRTKTSSNESSKISVKGTECPMKISKNKPFSIYFRIRSDVQSAQFCMFKMELTKSKRLATSNDLTNKKIQKVPTSISQMDPVKKVYSMQIVSTLAPGIYGLAYVIVNHKGHFQYDNFFCKSVYCIEITE